MFTRSPEKVTSNLYNDLNTYPGGLPRAATSHSARPPSPSTTPPPLAIQIKVEPVPIRTIGDVAPRKAPLPPPTVPSKSFVTPRTAPPPPVDMPRISSLKSSMSQRNPKEKTKNERMETFLMKIPAENPSPPKSEIAMLKTQIRLLETKVDELQLIVRVIPPVLGGD